MPNRSRPDARPDAHHDGGGARPGVTTLVPVIRSAPSHLRYLTGYPPHLLQQVQKLIVEGTLAETLARRYPDRHSIQSDSALYEYVMDLKARHMRHADQISKVAYDNKLKVITQALGTHTAVSRVQGGKLKAKREIRVASLFKDTAPEFLRMIAVHELAHLKEKAHDKAFYQLCLHMEPHYHQYEFDLRLHLVAQDLARLNDVKPAGPEAPQSTQLE
ncbi:MAG: M48 family peptidase [Burkholderiales bacterium]|jgi:predicted metal-dependent hydrolase|nr:MAG: M48 family peptidase [Burkholderiales bacterium]